MPVKFDTGRCAGFSAIFHLQISRNDLSFRLIYGALCKRSRHHVAYQVAPDALPVMPTMNWMWKL
jgi:hypothetical protein